MLSARIWILLAAGGSAALILSALGFQHLGGMAPCELCYWQRYPHWAAIGIGAVALLVPIAALCLLGALAALTTAGIGLYHTGVERDWWEGPAACSSGPASGMSADDLFAQIMAAPLVRCDEVPWQLFGLSMASWNMLASLALVACWIMAFRRA
jgi:disulfide bond formation protein DsbB